MLSFLIALALAVPPAFAATLDRTTFIVIGDGLAAGASGFGLSEPLQSKSFSAQLAGQLSTAFPQASFQAPGLGNVPGEPGLPVIVPSYSQTTVRTQSPPTLFVFNLSVPGFKLHDAISRRPALPLIRNGDWVQTMTNLILGFPALILEADVPLWSPVEYGVAMRPTLAVVELGYYDAIDAAVSADPARMVDTTAFRTDYEDIVKRLRAEAATVIVTTIPDPTATAYFSSLPSAAARLRQSASFLQEQYQLAPDDLLTEPAIRDISAQLLFGESRPLAPGRVLHAADAARIRERVSGWNSEIAAAANQHGAIVYDLAGLFARVRLPGVALGDRLANAAPFGGFFGLDGFHPGAAGHALIANEIIALLNGRFAENIPPIDLRQAAQDDPVLQYRDAGGRP